MVYARGCNVLILGAGPDQAEMYQTVKRAGAFVIGADAKPDAYARPFADRFLTLDGLDPCDIVNALKGRIPDAVFSPGNDSFHGMLDALGDIYGLRHRSSVEAIKASMDKGFFSNRVVALGLNAPVHRQSTRRGALKRFALTQPAPLIVKPSDSSGSKGISFVRQIDEFDAAFAKARRFSRSHTVIVERYVEGAQYGIESFFLDGKIASLAISHRGHSGPPDFLVMQHAVGFPLPHGFETRLCHAIERIADDLAIKNGPVNFDIVHGLDDAFYFLEMGARFSGNGFPALVASTHDIPMMDWPLRLALGQSLPLPVRPIGPKRMGVIRILAAPEAGRLKAIKGLDRLRSHPAYASDDLFVDTGRKVRLFRHPADRLGKVILTHERQDLIEDALDLLGNELSIEVTPETSIDKALEF